MATRSENTASTRSLTEEEMALVSGGARFNPQPAPPGVMHNPPDDIVSHNPPGDIVSHNPPGY